MRNGIAKGITAILIAGVLAAGVCCTGFASRGDDGKWFGNSDIKTWHWTDKTGDNSDGNHDNNKPVAGDSADLSFGVVEAYGVQLMSDKVEILSETGFVSYVVTATVIPSDAENQAVDWKLEAGENFDGDVNEFLSVVPMQDGSLTAMVTCKEAFTGVINLIVTTRDGGFSAVCAVTFIGKPAWIEVDTSSLSSVYDSGWGVDIYELETSSQFELLLSLSNAYGIVDGSISPNYGYQIIPHGEFYVADFYYEKGSVSNEVYAVVPVNYATSYIEGRHDAAVGGGKQRFYISHNLYELSIEGLVLNIKTFSQTPASISAQNALNASRTAYEAIRFDHYGDENKKPYMEILINDGVTNLTTSVNVRISSTVTGVSVDKSHLEF